MGHKYSFLIIGLGMMIGMSSSWAQEEDNVTTATSALQDVLTTLKTNVQQLTIDNDQLAVRDKTVREQIFQLQAQLGQVQQQGDVLNETAEKLKSKNPNREQQIARLEEENDDLDDRVQKAEAKIKLTQLGLDVEYQENQKLLLQLKGMPALKDSSQVESPEFQADARQQKEKLKLMKMIYDSRQRQASLHASILDYQKNMPLLPGASARAHQELLEEQIKDLENQIAAYPQEIPKHSGLNNPSDDSQLRQLELELKDLEQNYSQLKDLLEQMNKKAQGTRLTVSQHIEEAKLQNSIDDLKRQSIGLRADLDDLRSQMVDLDKRKSHLEVLIRQLPQ